MSSAITDVGKTSERRSGARMDFPEHVNTGIIGALLKWEGLSLSLCKTDRPRLHGQLQCCLGASACEDAVLRSCVKVEVAVLGSPSLIVLMVSVDVKQHRA